MKKDSTELIFILDKSGSMTGLENDTIGGFNSMLDKQKEFEGECRVTTVLFNHSYRIMHDRVDLQAVQHLTAKDYFVGGSTALLDAVGMTVQKMMNVAKHTSEEYRAQKVVFVIITDGEENSSREYTYDQVKKLIEKQKSEHAWEFVFLGANIDAVETGRDLGISEEFSVSYLSDAEGTRLNYKVMSEALSNYRTLGIIESEVFDEIRLDIEKRS